MSDIKQAIQQAAQVLVSVAKNNLDQQLSIVIAVYDSLNYTKDCIDSLLEHAPNAEIIIVNNGSQVDTKEYLDSLKYIKVIHWKENLGVSKAWNAGLKLATRDILCVLNNDVIIQPNGMHRLVEAAIETGVAGNEGACMNTDFCYAYSTYNADEADYLGGYCIVFRRDVWENVGVFDELFSPAYWEDNDWGLRVKEAGYKWKIIPGCVFHYVARTSTRVLDMGALFALQKVKFINKWGEKANGLGERILLLPGTPIDTQKCINEIRQRKPLAKIQLMSDSDDFFGCDCVALERKFQNYTQTINCSDYLQKPIFSFITWVNDENHYRNLLKSSHNLRVEYIRLGQEYDSMAKAYNKGTELATGDYLVYVHQDVEILDTFFEQKITNIFTNHSDIGFVGVIGSLTKDYNKSVWFHEGAHNCRGLAIQNQYKAVNLGIYNGVASLIDGLIMITDKVFNFPESIPHVHFIDAWMCNVASDAGLNNWIADILVNHNSGGETTSVFFKDNLTRYRLKWFMDDTLSHNTSFNDIKSMLNNATKKPSIKSGIAITTRNRPDMLDACLLHFKANTSKDALKHLIIYDDASDYEQRIKNQKIVQNHGLTEQYYIGTQQVGIAQAKNSCLYLLGNTYDYYFLFDDDTFPIKKGWIDLYINAHKQSGFQHLLYGNDACNTISDKVDGIEFYDRPWGVLLFFTQEVYRKLGGYRKEFGLYGAEHTDYTMRICEAGLTNLTKPFAGPIDCVSYIWNVDTQTHKQKTLCKIPNHEESISRQTKNIAVEIAHNIATTTQRQTYYPIIINHKILRIV